MESHRLIEGLAGANNESDFKESWERLTEFYTEECITDEERFKVMSQLLEGPYFRTLRTFASSAGIAEAIAVCSTVAE